MKRFLSAVFTVLCVWSLLVLFLCTACTNGHRHVVSQTCLTDEEKGACNLVNQLQLHCDLPLCSIVNPPEPCEDGKGHHGGHGDDECD